MTSYPIPNKKDTLCIVTDCGRKTHCRGLCSSCYKSARKGIEGGTMTWKRLEEVGMASRRTHREYGFFNKELSNKLKK